MRKVEPTSPDYSYQQPLIQQVLEKLDSHRKVVLAACPGAGKTHMALEIVKKFFKKHPTAKVLILTHGQVLLRDQWHTVIEGKTDFDSHGVIVSGKTAKDVMGEHQLVLSLPQTIRYAEIEKIDLLVVDEAHHRYMQGEVQEILESAQPEYELLLTGTPSLFLGNPEWQVVGVTIEELLPKGVVTDPLIEIIQTDYDYSLDDYDRNTMQLRQGKLSKEQTTSTLDHLLPQLVKRLTSANRNDPTKFDWAADTKDWLTAAKRLRKSMVICNNQQHARDVTDYFERHGIKCALSVSSTGDGTEEQKAFMEDPSVLFFIVVYRGTLGFNFTEMFNVIDLSGSLNVNRLFQQLCRIVRPSTTAPEQRKIYLKGTNPEMSFLTYYVMSYTVALSTIEHYYSYQTKFETRQIPVPAEFLETLDEYKAKKKENGDSKPTIPDLPELLTFTQVKLAKGAKTGTIGYTDFNTVMNRIGRSGAPYWTLEKVLAAAKKYKSRVEFLRNERGAWAYLERTKQTRAMDQIFGEVFRWDEKKIRETAKQYKTVSKFRKAHPGAYNWLYKFKKTHLLDEIFVTAGIVHVSLDHRITELLKDPRFEVRPDGTVYREGKRLNIRKKRGIWYVDFNVNKDRRMLSLARVMYRKFHGKIPKDCYVGLIDRTKLPSKDNVVLLSVREKNRRQKKHRRAETAAISSAVEKYQDKRHTGNARLSLEIAEAIRADYNAGNTYKDLTTKYGISKSTCSYIINRKIWA